MIASHRLRPLAVGLFLALPVGHCLVVAGCADDERDRSAVPGAAGSGGSAGASEIAGASGASPLGTSTATGTGTSKPPDPPLPDREDPACAINAEGIVLGGATSATGAPSYAFASCRLAYVAADGSLRDRDLITGTEITLAAASAKPSSPDRSTDLVAWDALTDAGRRVHVRRADGTIIIVGSEGQSASEARIFDKDIVFTVFPGSADGDADVALWEGATGEVRVLADGPAQQRFPAISRRFVAFADFSEAGPDGHFDSYRASLADIVVIDRATGARTVRALPGKQAFPMLDPELDVLGYLQWDEVRPEPKLGAPYGIRVGSIATPSLDRDIRAPDDGTSVAELRPSLRGGTFAWLERHEDGLRVLSRASTEGASAVSHAVNAKALAASPLAIGAEVLVSLQSPGETSQKLTRLP